MEKYIGVLSIIYIIISIVKLKDAKKSFYRHREEFKEMKAQLKMISEQKNPFIMMKFTSFVFYFFLILYYIANVILFNDYPLLDIISLALIILGVFKLTKKFLINSVDDFERSIEIKQESYDKKRKFNFILGLIEFAYAFNALSLISFYY
ncbi:hypothetical protein Halha_1620 [Halobacteroides halobius DSM 5150]|uniref:Uncharacterized protein n=1 Tax=Halobacteroides halobius (strain ATCC 35273 / DSM 5150 / MD-1) TaxID=748449 RepID=L0KBT8_HALHC|nr:hypothetical protein [Halobacteroides halobius]AGB41558.1 hypothetical protein Halha_1620 [Halobacteroides halobius DSM 5150]